MVSSKISFTLIFLIFGFLQGMDHPPKNHIKKIVRTKQAQPDNCPFILGSTSAALIAATILAGPTIENLELTDSPLAMPARITQLLLTTVGVLGLGGSLAIQDRECTIL